MEKGHALPKNEKKLDIICFWVKGKEVQNIMKKGNGARGWATK
jgi:hypothetical protein